jgi:glutamate dehydrogenase/leucine dehydrogenase
MARRTIAPARSHRQQVRRTAGEYDQPGTSVTGANIAGFVRVADAMLDEAVV